MINQNILVHRVPFIFLFSDVTEPNYRNSKQYFEVQEWKRSIPEPHQFVTNFIQIDITKTNFNWST